MRLIFAVPCLFVVFSWLVPLSIPLWAKLGGAVLLAVLSQYHAWCRLSSGSVFAPEFPRPLVIVFNWGFGAIAMLFVVQAALDVGFALASLVSWRWIAMPDAVRLGAGGVVAVLAAIGVAGAIAVPRVRDVSVAIPGLAPALAGYRVLQLTDLHLSRLFPQRWARAVVARANAAGCDLIVVTGDFIDGSVAMRAADIAPLADLRAPGGVWAVPGNHEQFFDYVAWLDHIRGLGIGLLLNAHVLVGRGAARFVLAGVTDPSARGRGHAGPDLEAALARAPEGMPVVLLDHQPGNARAAAAHGVALQLSGHTHGGMIVGLDRLVARGNAGFVSRRYAVGDMTLYVGNGTGLWPGFALRLGRSGEMTRFTLMPA